MERANLRNQKSDFKKYFYFIEKAQLDATEVADTASI